MCDVSIKVITWNRVIVFHPNLEFRHFIDNAISLLRLFAIAFSLRFVAQIGNTAVHVIVRIRCKFWHCPICCKIRHAAVHFMCEFTVSFDIVQFAAKFDMSNFWQNSSPVQFWTTFDILPFEIHHQIPYTPNSSFFHHPTTPKHCVHLSTIPTWKAPSKELFPSSTRKSGGHSVLFLCNTGWSLFTVIFFFFLGATGPYPHAHSLGWPAAWGGGFWTRCME